MNEIFKENLGKFILVFSSYLGHLKIALEILCKTKLVNNKKKYLFAKSQLEYLGHIILPMGVQVDPTKIESMTHWPVPKDSKSLRFFGFDWVVPEVR